MADHWDYYGVDVGVDGDYRGHDRIEIRAGFDYEIDLRTRGPEHHTGASGRADKLRAPRGDNLALDVTVREDGERVGHVQKQVYGTPTSNTRAAYLEEIGPDDVTALGQAVEDVLAERESVHDRMAVAHFFEDVRRGNVKLR